LVLANGFQKIQSGRKVPVKSTDPYLGPPGDFLQWGLRPDDGICEFPFGPESRKLAYKGKDEIYRYMTSYPEKMSIDSVTEMQIHLMLNPEQLVVELKISGRV
jgi:hypothetical protein